MKVKIVELEGTPEELAPYLPRLLGTTGKVSNDTVLASQALDPDLIEYLNNTVGAAGIRRELMDDLVRNVLSLGGDVEYRFGKTTASGALPRYVRFHRRGSGMGAFMQVSPERMRATFRLEASGAAGFEDAWARNVDPRNPYQVHCAIRSEASVTEATKLAEQAYDRLNRARGDEA